MSPDEWYKKWNKTRSALFDTPEYQIFRAEVILRAGGLCQEYCGRRGKEVHHVIRVVDNPNKALDPNNGVFLCRKCHKEIHHDER